MTLCGALCCCLISHAGSQQCTFTELSAATVFTPPHSDNEHLVHEWSALGGQWLFVAWMITSCANVGMHYLRCGIEKLDDRWGMAWSCLGLIISYLMSNEQNCFCFAKAESLHRGFRSWFFCIYLFSAFITDLICKIFLTPQKKWAVAESLFNASPCSKTTLCNYQHTEYWT